MVGSRHESGHVQAEVKASKKIVRSRQAVGKSIVKSRQRSWQVAGKSSQVQSEVEVGKRVVR